MSQTSLLYGSISPPPRYSSQTGSWSSSINAPLTDPRGSRTFLVPGKPKSDPCRASLLVLLLFFVIVPGIVAGFLALKGHLDYDRVLRMREAAIKDKEDTMRRDEEHRQRSGLVWDNLKADQGCLSFASRRYTAELVNVPTDPDVDGLKWCMETQIEIHGAMYEHPRRCVRDNEDKIIAEWITHSNEPTCRTFWDHHTKKGWNGNHKRIFEAKLENHQPPWDNWQEMCVSTPSHFNYGHHDHPDICRETAHDGIFGAWFVFDEECP